MLLLNPYICELLYLLISSFSIAYFIGKESLYLTVVWSATVLLAIWVDLKIEFRRSRSISGSVAPYTTRTCKVQGVAIGTLALPTIMACMALASGSGLWQQQFECSILTAVITIIQIVLSISDDLKGPLHSKEGNHSFVGQNELQPSCFSSSKGKESLTSRSCFHLGKAQNSSPRDSYVELIELEDLSVHCSAKADPCRPLEKSPLTSSKPRQKKVTTLHDLSIASRGDPNVKGSLNSTLYSTHNVSTLLGLLILGATAVTLMVGMSWSQSISPIHVLSVALPPSVLSASFFHAIMNLLPLSFTLGEGLFVSHSLTLLTIVAVKIILNWDTSALFQDLGLKASSPSWIQCFTSAGYADTLRSQLSNLGIFLLKHASPLSHLHLRLGALWKEDSVVKDHLADKGGMASTFTQVFTTLPVRLSEQVPLSPISVISDDEPLHSNSEASIDDSHAPSIVNNGFQGDQHDHHDGCWAQQSGSDEQHEVVIQFVVLLIFSILLLAACVWTLSWSWRALSRAMNLSREQVGLGGDEDDKRTQKVSVLGRHEDAGVTSASRLKGMAVLGRHEDAGVTSASQLKGMAERMVSDCCHKHWSRMGSKNGNRPLPSSSSSAATIRTHGIMMQVLMCKTVPILLMAAAAAVLLIMAAAVVVGLAFWVLTVFLPGRLSARLYTLMYWMLLLAAALPLMYIALHGSMLPKVHSPKVKASSVVSKDSLADSLDFKGSRVLGKGGCAGDGSTAKEVEGSAALLAPRYQQAGSESSSLLTSTTAAELVSATGYRKRRKSVKPWVPHILLRKGYHVIALMMFTPILLLDPHMLQVSMAIAFAVFVLLEVLRCSEFPELSQMIQGFMSGFTDERDAGPVYVTHFALLLGMAAPMWLSLFLIPGHSIGEAGASCYSSTTSTQALLQYNLSGLKDPGQLDACGRSTSYLCGSSGALAEGGGGGHSEIPLTTSDLALNPSCSFQAATGLLCLLVSASGLICLGLGDTAASVVGVLLGRWRLLKGSSKTAEGTLAGAAAMLCGVLGVAATYSCLMMPGCEVEGHYVSTGSYLQNFLGYPVLLGPLTVVTFGAAVLEAVTGQLDNLVVPVYYTAHLLVLYGTYCRGV